MNKVMAIVTYVRRNIARIVEIVEKVLAVVEKVVAALIELVPLTPTKKDDVIVNVIHVGVGRVRKLLDKWRDKLLELAIDE